MTILRLLARQRSNTVSLPPSAVASSSWSANIVQRQDDQYMSNIHQYCFHKRKISNRHRGGWGVYIHCGILRKVCLSIQQPLLLNNIALQQCRQHQLQHPYTTTSTTEIASSFSTRGVNILEELSFRIRQKQQQSPRHTFHPKQYEGFGSFSSSTTTTKALASQFCSHYLSLPPINLHHHNDIEEGKQSKKDTRDEILNHFIQNCNIDPSTVAKLLHSTPVLNEEEQGKQSLQFYSKIREACVPLYEHIFTLLVSQTDDDDSDTASSSIGMKCVITIRQDLQMWNMKMAQLQHSLHLSHNEKSNKEGEDLEAVEQEILLKKQKIKQMNLDIKNMLSVWFSAGILELRRITYDSTPASIIEQIALKEAVHPLRNLDDLRTRLGPNRRCYAFFHPSFLVNEPLVFVHVALIKDCIPASMEDIDRFTANTDSGSSSSVTSREEKKDKKVAVFYSITSTQPGLSGVDLGNFLIKRVVDVLKKDFPKMETFVTLSPLPRFRKWVEGKLRQQQQQRDTQNDHTPKSSTASSKFVDDTLFTKEEELKLQKVLKCENVENIPSALLQTLEDLDWCYPSDEKHRDRDRDNTMTSLSSTLEPILLKLAARYLIREKHRGKPLDGVAKFHLRNGAEMYRLNYMADLSRKGKHNSWGIMINYRYCLEPEGVLEENQLMYEGEGRIKAREGVVRWLDDCDGAKEGNET